MTLDLHPSMADKEQQALLDLVDAFGRDVVSPLVRDYDMREQLPPELLRQMGELGFFGGVVPTELGGAGLGFLTFSRVIETISKYDHCLGVLMSMPSALVGAALLDYGAPAQQEEWLRPLAQGDIFGAAGVTEPRSGSDVAGTDTRYRVEPDGTYVLNGAKAWITNIDIASFFVTFATRDRSLGRAGISAFLVPADTPGVIRNPFKNKLGFRPLCTGELVFDNVHLTADSLIGTEGEGFAVAMTAVERGRLAVASRAVGLAQACLDDSVSYAKERVVFDRSLSEFQMVQKKISDMAVNVQAARLLTERSAMMLQTGSRARSETSMAKMFASDVAQAAATDAVQIHGANGVSDEYRVARFYRDAKVFQIVEGANDIHRHLIAREEFGRSSRRQS